MATQAITKGGSMNKAKEKAIDRELRLIQERDGTLKPDAVVEFARNPKTALHSQFDWDDTEAARKYRLWQARQVIAVRVKVLPRMNEPTRVWVSLPTDRQTGQGYRSIVSVMSDEDRKRELLRMALAEAKLWRRKYEHLRELSQVFEAIDVVTDEVEQAELVA